MTQLSAFFDFSSETAVSHEFCFYLRIRAVRTSSYFLRDVYDDDVLNEKTHLFSSLIK